MIELDKLKNDLLLAIKSNKLDKEDKEGAVRLTKEIMELVKNKAPQIEINKKLKILNMIIEKSKAEPLDIDYYNRQLSDLDRINYDYNTLVEVEETLKFVGKREEDFRKYSKITGFVSIKSLKDTLRSMASMTPFTEEVSVAYWDVSACITDMIETIVIPVSMTQPLETEKELLKKRIYKYMKSPLVTQSGSELVDFLTVKKFEVLLKMIDLARTTHEVSRVFSSLRQIINTIIDV